MFNLINTEGNTNYCFNPVGMILFSQIIILTIKKWDKSGYQRGDESTNFWWKYKYEETYINIISGDWTFPLTMIKQSHFRVNILDAFFVSSAKRELWKCD